MAGRLSIPPKKNYLSPISIRKTYEENIKKYNNNNKS
tara:strand:- start:678 stop:788 length:111 start_codon:yes stop_codon:yes gene_type:complete